MKRWTIALIVMLGLFALVFVSTRRDQLSAQSHAQRTPVIVELFTSEGCSSCPPADELLITLQNDQPVAAAEIIALGEHVDYWDRLGWADRFSSAVFTDRQNDYARAFRTNKIYTPQMVVDGRTELIGSQRGAAQRAIAQAARAPKANVLVSAGAAPAEDGIITIRARVEKLPRITPRDTAEVWLAITETGLRTDVRRGENARRRLRHTGVVRKLELVDSLHVIMSAAFSTQSRVALEPDWRRENLRAVVFVQERQSRRVLGAGQARLGS